MLPYARLTPGPGFQPLRAGLYYAQRLVTAPRLRRSVARCLAFVVNRHQAARGAASLPADLPGDRGAALELHGQGITRLPALLSPATCRDIREWLAARPVLGPQGTPTRLDALLPGTATAAYALEDVLACPHVLDLVNRPGILGLAGRYLGCRPTVSSLGLRWSLPGAGRPADVQHFHRDTDDWRFLKLFVYLTEVDRTSGPHLYVTGSHRTAGRLRARPYTRVELEQSYGGEAITAVTGPAGTSFLADTYGIHAGAMPERRPRLILQVQYSVLPVFAFTYDPVPWAAGLALDRYVNRLLITPRTPAATATAGSRPEEAGASGW